MRKGASEDAMLAPLEVFDPRFTVPAGGVFEARCTRCRTRSTRGWRPGARRHTRGETRTMGKSRKKQRKGGDADAVVHPRSADVMHERACAALGMLLELLPHAKPVAMRYSRHARAVLSALRRSRDGGIGGGDGGGGEMVGDDVEGSSREHALLVARSCVRLLRALGPAAEGSGARVTSAPERDDDDSCAVRPADAPASAGVLAHWDCSRARCACSDTPTPRFDGRYRRRWSARWVFPPRRSPRSGPRTRPTPPRRTPTTRVGKRSPPPSRLKRRAPTSTPALLFPPLRRRETNATSTKTKTTKTKTTRCSTTCSGLPAAPGHVRVGGVEVRNAHSCVVREKRRDDDDDPHRERRAEPPRGGARAVQEQAPAPGGPAGAGKSAVLEEVASLTGNDDFVVLHLDAQTDSKSLLGSYVVGAAPGEFKWQPGALTQAVASGRWGRHRGRGPRAVRGARRAGSPPGGAKALRTRARRIRARRRGVSALRHRHRGWGKERRRRRGGGARGSTRGAVGARRRGATDGERAHGGARGVHPRLEPLAPAMLETLNVAQKMCGQGGAAAAPGGTKRSRSTLPGFEDSDGDGDGDGDGDVDVAVMAVDGDGADKKGGWFGVSARVASRGLPSRTSTAAAPGSTRVDRSPSATYSDGPGASNGCERRNCRSSDRARRGRIRCRRR